MLGVAPDSRSWRAGASNPREIALGLAAVTSPRLVSWAAAGADKSSHAQAPTPVKTVSQRERREE